MSKTNDGGPAFPVDAFAAHQPSTVDEAKRLLEGMSLRDYFAAKALPGIITAIMHYEGHRWLPTDFAKEAYEMADAMIDARDQ